MNSFSEQQVIELYKRFVVPSYERSLVLVRGKGTEVWDINGKRYLDFGGGIAVNALGHAHPAIQEALQQQSAELIHCSNLYHSIPQALLAERIVNLIGPGKAFFCNSGAEANEALYKLARKVGHEKGHYEIITTTNSFHGRTLAGIAATGQEKVRTGFDPLTPGFKQVPFNDLSALSDAIGEKTIAVLIEGIQGEGGVIPATSEYLLGLRQLCNEQGLLLLMDAVQCGMFRTGCFQSYQRILEDVVGEENFRPDGISMAKSLGGGFPIGAVWISEKYADVFQPGSHGTTYGGTPLACSVSLTVLNIIEQERLAQNARRQGEHMRSRLAILAARSPEKIRAVRGYGCMIGVELVHEITQILAELRQYGLLLIPSGKQVLRFLPPLNVSEAEVEEALSIFDQVLGK